MARQLPRLKTKDIKLNEIVLLEKFFLSSN